MDLRKFSALSLTALALFSGATLAEGMGVHTTKYALDECKTYLQMSELGVNPNALQAMHFGSCGGYIRGFYEAVMLEKEREIGPPLVCFPEREWPSLDRLAQTYVDFVEQRPDLLEKPRFVSTYLAFSDAYPCE